MMKEVGLLMSKILGMIEEQHERKIDHPVSRPNMKETTVCPKCGYAVIDRWNYCPFCGTRLAPIPKEKYKEQ